MIDLICCLNSVFSVSSSLLPSLGVLSPLASPPSMMSISRSLPVCGHCAEHQCYGSSTISSALGVEGRPEGMTASGRRRWLC